VIHDLRGKRVYVAGHRGLVGSAVGRRLAKEDCEIVTVGRDELDLRRQSETEDFMAATHPDVVVIAAARVGGILANDTFRADFLYDNLMIGANLLAAAHRQNVARVLFLGSSCIYPRAADQPIDEAALLAGALEPTNEAYAVAKIAGLKLVDAYRRQHGRDWISAMPTNLYGPGDSFDPFGAHVVPALIRKAHEALTAGTESLTLWGTGAPLREFLHADDCADAIVFLLQNWSAPGPVNVGSGVEISILDLARLVCEIVGFTGDILFDPTKPDGAPRKLLDTGKLAAMGWKASIGLREGLRQTYEWYMQTIGSA
jgi:GDP-L-fucose synthase